MWFKVSAPYRWPDPALVAEAVDRMVATQAGQRLIWGSDWPHTQHEAEASYADMVRHAHQAWPAALSEAFDQNLQRLLGDRRF